MLNDLVDLYKSKIAVSLIYIHEAHAQDRWPISSGRFNRGRGPIIVQSPNTTMERVMLALRLKKDFDLHEDIQVLVDSVDHGDVFLRRFTPWPIQVFLLNSFDSTDLTLHTVFHPINATIPLDSIYDTLANVLTN